MESKRILKKENKEQVKALGVAGVRQGNMLQYWVGSEDRPLWKDMLIHLKEVEEISQADIGRKKAGISNILLNQ